MGDGGAVSRRHIRCQRFGTSAAVFRPTTEGRRVAHRNRGLGRDTRSRNGRCHHRRGRRSAGRRDRIAARLLRDDEETRRGSAGRSPEGSPRQRVAPAILETPDKKGGAATANGGNGGDAEPWSLVTGGNVVVFGTIDVTGAPNCPNTGGAGGKGGDASGGGGDRGNGAAGAGGTNATSAQEQAAHPGPGSFQPGSPGGACPSTNVTVNLTSSTPTLNPGVVSPGTYSVQLRDAATNAVVGAMSFVAAGTAFYGSSPSRVGWSGGRRFVDSQRR